MWPATLVIRVTAFKHPRAEPKVCAKAKRGAFGASSTLLSHCVPPTKIGKGCYGIMHICMSGYANFATWTNTSESWWLNKRPLWECHNIYNAKNTSMKANNLLCWNKRMNKLRNNWCSIQCLSSWSFPNSIHCIPILFFQCISLQLLWLSHLCVYKVHISIVSIPWLCASIYNACVAMKYLNYKMPLIIIMLSCTWLAICRLNAKFLQTYINVK